MAHQGNSLTWLHLSDAHLPPGGEDDYRVDKALDALIETLREDNANRRAPDLIFFTGDLAAKGKCYAKARRFFDDLLAATGLSGRLGETEAKRRLFLVPGNHDVDRSKTKFVRRPLTTQDECDEFFAPGAGEDRGMFFDRFQAYATFFNEYFDGVRQISAEDHAIAETIAMGPEGRGLRVGVIGLNSAWFSQDDHDRNQLWTGQRTCDLAMHRIGDRSSCDLLIVLTHHPLTWLNDVDEKPVRGFLSSRYAVHLFGHEHRATTPRTEDESGERLGLCTGALFESSTKPKRALWGSVDRARRALTVRPIRYEPGPPASWTIDTSLYPACKEQEYCKTFDLPRAGASRPRPRPPAEAARTTAYLEALRRRTSYIDITGMRTGSGEAYSLPIDDIYIPLTTSAPGRHDYDGDRELDVAQERAIRRVELHEAVANPRTVIVGDPGAGKTTFLRRVANLRARDALGLEGGGERAALPVLVKLARLLAFMKEHRAEPGAPGHPDTPCWLARYCGTRSAECGSGLDEAFFQSLLDTGKAIVLLDGLDEAPSAEDRLALRRWLEEASAAYPDCRFVATTRPAGHRGLADVKGFREVTIDPLEEEAVYTFFDHWSRALYPNDATRARRECSALGEAHRSRGDLRRLARNPVMLTALAALHHNQKKLPEQRAELYESIIEWLSSSRPREGRAEPARCVALLQNVALAMQAHPGGRIEQMARPEAARAIRSSWRGVSDDQAQAEAERFLEEEEAGSGIIVKRGEHMAFWHLTFQEFLAARALAARDADREKLLRSDRVYRAEWREVVLLLAGVLYRHGRERVDGMFSTVLEALGDNASLEARARCVGLLGAAVRDLSPVGYQPSDARYGQMMAAVKDIFDAEASRGIEIDAAIGAAEALAQTGDLRFADPLAPLRDPAHKHWAPIRPGAFRMGAQEADDSAPDYDSDASEGESPVHQVRLSAYRIGKYPVTVGEYAKFVEEDGYGKEAFWQAGRFGQFRAPGAWEDQLEHPTRPVVGVNWHEACAYAAWATARLREAGHEGVVRLPTEAEWERAARGTEGRKDPWGGDGPNDRLLNFGANVGAPTPVGVYPLGATPEGLCDLAGNVWEWCSDWFGSYADAKDVDPQGPPSGSGRVLRGGSWNNDPQYCRSAYRYRHRPDVRFNDTGFRVVYLGLVYAPASVAARSDALEARARNALSQGDYSEGRRCLVEAIKADPGRKRRLITEVGFMLDLAGTPEEDQSLRQQRPVQVEWRRRVWLALSRRCEFELPKPREAGVVAETSTPEAEPPPVEELPRPSAVPGPPAMASEEIGEDLERATLELLARLFLLGEDAEQHILRQLRQQDRGFQFGYDVGLTWGVKGNRSSRCLVECKVIRGAVKIDNISSKILQAERYSPDIDHWLLISPCADPSNDLAEQLEEWQRSERFPFRIHVWSPCNGVADFFGLSPELYDHWGFSPHPGEVHPRGWDDAKRDTVVGRFLGLLEPPLRLPKGWSVYARDSRKLMLPSDPPAGHLEHLAASHIPLRGFEETGAPIHEPLLDMAISWLATPVTQSRCLLVLGEFGDGKTFFTYLLARALLERFRREPRTHVIPVRLSLRDFSRPGIANGRDLLRLRLEDVAADLDGWNELKRQGRLFVILDGFDEMSIRLDEAAVERNIQILRDCCENEFGGLKVLLTSGTHFLESSHNTTLLMDVLGRPRRVYLRNFDRDEVQAGLASRASCDEERAGLQALHGMYDPIGIAAKPLFYEMVSEVLPMLRLDSPSVTDIYEAFILRCLKRKLTDLQPTEFTLTQRQLVDRLGLILEGIALGIHCSGEEGASLRELADTPNHGRFAKLLWDMTATDRGVDADATTRVRVRSLLRPVTPWGTAQREGLWDVDFFHRSVREYFVARGLVRLLTTDLAEARRVLRQIVPNHEILQFAASLLRRQRSHAWESALRGLALDTRHAGISSEARARKEASDARLAANAVSLLSRATGQLPERDWCGLTLDGCDLSGADLSGKSFAGTSLRYADLDNVTLVGCDLTDADLTGVRLDETAEILSLAIPAGGDCFYAGYRDGRIWRWPLGPEAGTRPQEIYRGPATASMTIAAVPTGCLCVLNGDTVSFLDERDDGTLNVVASFEIRPNIVQTILQLGAMCYVEVEEQSSSVVVVLDLQEFSVKARMSIATADVVDHVGTDGIVVEDRKDGRMWVHSMGTALNPLTLFHGGEVLSLATRDEALANANRSILIACGRRDGHVRVWRVTSQEAGWEQEEVVELRAHDEAVTSVVFIDRHRLLTGGIDRRIKLIDLNEGSVLREFALSLSCWDTKIDGLKGEKEHNALRAIMAKSARDDAGQS